MIAVKARDGHYVPSTRSHQWKRARCASGLGTPSLLNVDECPITSSSGPQVAK